MYFFVSPVAKTTAATVGLAATAVIGQVDPVGGGGTIDLYAQWGIVGLALGLLGYILKQVLGKEPALVSREFALTLGKEAGRQAGEAVYRELSRQT